MPSVSYLSPRFAAIDDAGRPFVGARLYTYDNKTTTPSPTWKDAAQAAANTNPLVLDARGEAVAFVDPLKRYTFVLRGPDNALIWSQDDIVGGASGLDIKDLQDQIDDVKEDVESGVLVADSETVTMAGTGREDAPITAKVRVSAATGNRIEQRADGLAVIDAAPPNLSLQYVSANLGNDNNAGTRESPLRTIHRALERIAAGSGIGYYTIALRAGETFGVGGALPRVDNAFLRITVYDDPKYLDSAVTTPYPGYYSVMANDLLRPVIAFQTYPESGFLDRAKIVAKDIDISGLIVRSDNPEITLPGSGPYVFQCDNFRFVGCDFFLTSDAACLFFAATLTDSGQSLLTMSAGARLGYGLAQYWIRSPDSYTGYTASAPGYPTFTGRAGNEWNVLTPDNIQAAGTYNASTKTSFGWSTTWDIFA